VSSKSGSRRIRLAYGEVASQDVQVLRAREQFLWDAGDLYPALLDELWDVQDATGLEVWLTRWSFSEPWVREAAEFTLRIWREGDDGVGPIQSPEPPEIDYPPPEPLMLDWHPDEESEDVFRREVQQRVEQHVAARLAFLGQGVSRPPLRAHDHFVWLAHHRVGGLGWTQIARLAWHDDARRDDSDRLAEKASAVQKAVAELATFIGIGLRDVPKGRPLKRG
jgi:hypothetical protein